jgi:Zn-dependent protease with chaperone function
MPPATCSASTSAFDERRAARMTDMDAPSAVVVDYFDGRSARAHRASVRVEAGMLRIEGDDVRQAVALANLQWPERTRHGARLLNLPGGASVHCRDSVAWDRWVARVVGRRDSLVVRAQQRWRWVAASLLAIVAITGIGYVWGLPLAARVIVSQMPTAIDDAVGDSAVEALDREELLGPSHLDPARQQAIRSSLDDAVAHLPAAESVRYRLVFRSGPGIGPNAFALPGGAIVVTDELVERVHGDRGMIIGVLGHELGHLRHRHGMRLLVEASVISTAAGAFYGDFSALLAVVPTWLAQAKYSRDAEREADLAAVQILRANGISPAVMADFFTAMRQPAKGDGAQRPPTLGMGLASHPADDERVEFFRQAARSR